MYAHSTPREEIPKRENLCRKLKDFFELLLFAMFIHSFILWRLRPPLVCNVYTSAKKSSMPNHVHICGPAKCPHAHIW